MSVEVSSCSRESIAVSLSLQVCSCPGVKRHIAVDVLGLLSAVVVTASIQDRDAAQRLHAMLRGTF